jgi:arginase family enzyme
VLDPLQRWASVGEKPDYAGLLTFAGVPYTQDAVHLEGVDVAIVGAPMDDLVSDRPGTRFGPRAIRAASSPSGPELGTWVDAISELRVVDFGDAPVLPADPVRSHAAIEATVAQVLAVGLVHFDTHTDTGTEVFGVETSHGTIMRRLVEAEHVDPRRYAQVGLRGYWPGKEEFAWQTERGITSLFMHHIRDLGIREVVRRAEDAMGDGPVFLSVDIDVLDPAFAPGTGTPEPGGMTTDELLWAVREVAMRLEVIGADMVEVIPTGVGSADITALAADRIVREILGGIALRKRRQNTGQPDDKEER